MSSLIYGDLQPVRGGYASRSTGVRPEERGGDRTHLRADRLQFVVVTEDAQGFADAILGENPTPIHYQSPPDSEILAEDAVIEKLRLPLERANVRIVPVDEVFQRARR